MQYPSEQGKCAINLCFSFNINDSVKLLYGRNRIITFHRNFYY